MAIMLIGLLLGIGSGVGTASLREFTDQSARNPEELAMATGLPVLAAIPTIVTVQENKKQWRRVIWIYAGVVLAVFFGLILLHLFVIDLDMLWIRLIRKMEM
jgi:succinoglycan biosynthesis transport protein ExoP